MPSHQALSFPRANLLLFATCVVLWCTVGVDTTRADPLKLGVLVPTVGPNQSWGRQIAAGVEVAANTLNVTTTLPAGWDGENLEEGFRKLGRHRVEIIIAGIGNQQIKQWLRTTRGSSRPAILLARNHQSESIKPLLRDHKILKFGYTYDDFQRVGLEAWVNTLDLNRIAIFYDPRYERLKKVWSALLAKRSGKVQPIPIRKLATTPPHAPNVDGVTFVGRRWEIDKRIRTWKPANIPIFLPGPYYGPALKSVMSHRSAEVYFGVEALPKENAKILELARVVNNALSWSPKSFSYAAVDAYDATKFAASAWHSARTSLSRPNATKPWNVALNAVPRREVTGIAGPIKFSKKVEALVRPAYVVKASPSGLVVQSAFNKK